MSEIPQLTDAEIRAAFSASAPDAPLVDRLRHPPNLHSPVGLRMEAADEITRLRAENARLRAVAFEECARIAETYPSGACKRASTGENIAMRIRAALAQKEGE